MELQLEEQIVAVLTHVNTEQSQLQIARPPESCVQSILQHGPPRSTAPLHSLSLFDMPFCRRQDCFVLGLGNRDCQWGELLRPSAGLLLC